MDYSQYMDYIANTGYVIRSEWFDEDWEPIGPKLRQGMLKEGLITIDEKLMIRLTEKAMIIRLGR